MSDIKNNMLMNVIYDFCKKNLIEIMEIIENHDLTILLILLKSVDLRYLRVFIELLTANQVCIHMMQRKLHFV